MLRCPKCNRTYENDAQKFCTRDGGRLTVVETETPNFNPNATIVSPPPFDPNKTIVSQPEPSFDANKMASNQTQASNDEILQTISVSHNESQGSQTPADQPLPVVPIETEEHYDLTSPPLPYQQNASQPYAHGQHQQSPQIPMPVRYDPTSPTATDLNYSPGTTPSSRHENADYPSPSSARQREDEAEFEPPGETQYHLPSPAENSVGFQNEYDASFGQTVSYVPQNYAGQNADYQNTNAALQKFPLDQPSTPVASQPDPVGEAVPQPKNKSKKFLFLGLGAVLFAFLVGAASLVGFVLIAHPEWVGLGQTPSNENQNTSSLNTNENANTVNTNESLNENANISATTNANTNDNANANTGENTNANTSAIEPPPNSTQFSSSTSDLNNDLAKHYSPFSFYYPQNWSKISDEKGYFVEVIRKADKAQEYFAVGYYNSEGSLESDKKIIEPQFKSKSEDYYKRVLTNYQRVGEGETSINGASGYEYKFTGDNGGVRIYGRVVFLPPNIEGSTNGIKLVMYATSLAPEVQSLDDFGVKGELPMILNTFKLGQ